MWKFLRKTKDLFLIRVDNNFDYSKFTFQSKEGKYNIYRRRYEWVTVTDHLYQGDPLIDSNGTPWLTFKIGWVQYFLEAYPDRFSPEDLETMRSIIYSDIEYGYIPQLTEEQNLNMSACLKYTRSIFQGATGTGKSECIIATTKWILDNTDYNVVLMVPSTPALNNLRERSCDERYRLNLDYYYDETKRVQLIDCNGFLRSNAYKPTSDYWKKPTILFCDEVEHVNTSSAVNFISNLNYLQIVGFSATPDKLSAQPIIPKNLYVCQRNRDLIDTYGFQSVSSSPEGFTIDMVNIDTNAFIGCISEETDCSIYSEIVYNLFVYPSVVRAITKIVAREGCMYVPMFRLQVIDDIWSKNMFTNLPKDSVVISGRGIERYSHIDGSISKLDSYNDLNALIENEEISLITGTRPSSMAINLPALSKVMLLSSKTASVCLQQIGRATRQKRFSIFTLKPLSYVNKYTPDMKSRLKLIKNYFKRCRIFEQKRLETYYGI